MAITKRNILKKTDGLFFEEVEKSVKSFPNMELQEIYIDNMAQQLVINPEQFNNSVLVSFSTIHSRYSSNSLHDYNFYL